MYWSRLKNKGHATVRFFRVTHRPNQMNLVVIVLNVRTQKNKVCGYNRPYSRMNRWHFFFL